MTDVITFLQKQLGQTPAILGLSGGVDSAVVLALLVQAIPVEQIHVLIMPSTTTNPVDVTDAIALAEQYKVNRTLIPITKIMEAYHGITPDLQHPVAAANLQARIRMTLLYARANALGGKVVGTGNKSELLTGYFTKYGDGGVDLLPIGNYYKTHIWKLAKQLNLPNRFITKAPTAGLKPNQTDEAELGMSYSVLDGILQALETNSSTAAFEATQVQRVQTLKNLAAHKLVLPPIGPQPQ